MFVLKNYAICLNGRSTAHDSIVDIAVCPSKIECMIDLIEFSLIEWLESIDFKWPGLVSKDSFNRWFNFLMEERNLGYKKLPQKLVWNQSFTSFCLSHQQSWELNNWVVCSLCLNRKLVSNFGLIRFEFVAKRISFVWLCIRWSTDVESKFFYRSNSDRIP